jgi:uncharacterized protein YdcH (DUF465 family)
MNNSTDKDDTVVDNDFDKPVTPPTEDDALRNALDHYIANRVAQSKQVDEFIKQLKRLKQALNNAWAENRGLRSKLQEHATTRVASRYYQAAVRLSEKRNWLLKENRQLRWNVSNLQQEIQDLLKNNSRFKSIMDTHQQKPLRDPVLVTLIIICVVTVVMTIVGVVTA